MNNELLADHIGLLAKASADTDYVRLRSVLKSLTLDELRQVKNVVNDLNEEINEWYRKAVTS